MDGFSALLHLQKTHPNIPVIILTGDVDSNSAAKAMQAGAIDFLKKPIESARLHVSVRNALKMSLMRKEIKRLKSAEDGAAKFDDLIGHREGLKHSVDIGRKAAACSLPVIITGETGTGKEIFSRAIHGESDRAEHPFIAVNCGAIPENLVESTLFGHEKGSFTGAINKALGKFQEAEGGTIFLDEVGELPPEAQVKLLRVLQESEVEPVGAAKSVSVNVRVLSATNRDLKVEVQEGRFREDLYFRLNVLHIDLPPLRERPDDVLFLSQYFVSKFCKSHNTEEKKISPAAFERLEHHLWPGNVRELENTVNRAMALCDDNHLDAHHFSFFSSHDRAFGAGRDIASNQHSLNVLQEDGSFKNFKTLEHEILSKAVAHHGGNMTQTAKVLGIAKSTLYKKLDNIVDLKSA